MTLSGSQYSLGFPKSQISRREGCFICIQDQGLNDFESNAIHVVIKLHISLQNKNKLVRGWELALTFFWFSFYDIKWAPRWWVVQSLISSQSLVESTEHIMSYHHHHHSSFHEYIGKWRKPIRADMELIQIKNALKIQTRGARNFIIKGKYMHMYSIKQTNKSTKAQFRYHSTNVPNVTERAVSKANRYSSFNYCRQ